MKPVPSSTLHAIEQQLHTVIREGVARFIDKDSWPLPSLTAMLAGEATESLRPISMTGDWFHPVPGMRGGFLLRWCLEDVQAKLRAVSFSHGSDVSVHRHEVTADDAELVESARPVEPIPDSIAHGVEQQLHTVIREGAARFIDKHSWALPSLAAMLAGEPSEILRPTSTPNVWFYSVPGMYGGFRLRWLVGGVEAKLESVSFRRISGGSARLHEITTEDGKLVESGMF